MNKYLLSALIILSLYACAKDEGLPAGLRGGGFELADNTKHELALDEMSRQSIPFETNERGMVIYMQKDKAKVLGILRKVQYGNELTNNIIESEAIADAKYKDILVSKFEQQGIPYNIHNTNGLEQIKWVQLYGLKVDVIIQEAGFERHNKNN